MSDATHVGVIAGLGVMAPRQDISRNNCFTPFFVFWSMRHRTRRAALSPDAAPPQRLFLCCIPRLQIAKRIQAHGKLQGVGSHDDTVMAFWMADQAARVGGASTMDFNRESGGIAPMDHDDKDSRDWFGHSPQTIAPALSSLWARATNKGFH